MWIRWWLGTRTPKSEKNTLLAIAFFVFREVVTLRRLPVYTNKGQKEETPCAFLTTAVWLFLKGDQKQIKHLGDP